MRWAFLNAVEVVLCWMLFFVLPAQADPVAWTDRCLIASDENQETGLLRGHFKAEDCIETVLNYCTFDGDSDACFVALSDAFTERADLISATLPAKIKGPKVQQLLYQRRLARTRGVTPLLPCPQEAAPHACRAEEALLRYQLIRSLPEWITKFEEPK